MSIARETTRNSCGCDLAVALEPNGRIDNRDFGGGLVEEHGGRSFGAALALVKPAGATRGEGVGRCHCPSDKRSLSRKAMTAPAFIA